MKNLKNNNKTIKLKGILREIDYLPPVKIDEPTKQVQIAQKSKDMKFVPFIKTDIKFDKKEEPTKKDQTAITFFKLTPEFINYIKDSENAGRTGFNNKINKWFPHISPEGGLDTIGYGHKFDSKIEQEKYRKVGATEKEISDFLSSDLAKAKIKVDSDLKMMGLSLPKTNEQYEMLIDFAYNLGSIKKFPKFSKAVINNDWNTVKLEYKRKFKDVNGKTKDLERRNKLFYDRYLKNK